MVISGVRSDTTWLWEGVQKVVIKLEKHLMFFLIYGKVLKWNQ
jgi:hypothetical protein